MNTILSLNNLNKTYEGGFEALKDINLEIRRGEIFALLGPNGAGKTTLINSVCGLVMPTSGQIHFDGKDIAGDFRYARERIGLVPQELCTDAFETPWDTVHFSRGLFGKPRDGAYVEQVLRNLSLWDKRKNMIRTLSGGMKRRVMIAKALSHEPQLLFLDEPTAGVDVELRKGMWDQVRALQKTGVTIILTTHYIDEAEEMADRIGIISQGELILVDRKEDLIKKLGRKEMILDLLEPLQDLPAGLSRFDLTLSDDRRRLSYTFDSAAEDNGIAQLLSGLLKAGYECRDINTKQSSLEEIFISLVNKKMNWLAVKAIYHFEMHRMLRTLGQSIASPVISTGLYFIVFGSAIGSRIDQIDGVSYGSFIVPGLIMLTVLSESISNASFGIYFPKFTGTIYEILSAPVSYVEILIGYVGAAATKSIIIGMLILGTSFFFVPVSIAHPLLMLTFLVLTAVTFSLFGFLIGIWADGFEKLQIIPLLIITPLAFLGGSFYSITMLPPVWQKISLLNPVVYLISGFRWSFYESADVSLGVSLGMIAVFLLICLAAVRWMFATGYKLKT